MTNWPAGPPLRTGRQGPPLGEDLLLLAVGRGSEILIPHGRTVLRSGDRLTVLGTGKTVWELADRLGDGLYPDASMK